jgi:NADP-dependent 3-hydroxy acid dehydrogenase YdfG
MDVEGRRVLVTGASRGLGSALAGAFATAGARLALVARDGDALSDVAARCDGHVYVADLTDAGQLRVLVARVEADGGPVDVLVNNAGVETAGALHMQSADDVEQLLRLNVLAPTELARQVLPGMLARGSGSLVLISLLAGVGTFPGMAAYGASKAALTRLAAGVRADVRGSGIGRHRRAARTGPRGHGRPRRDLPARPQRLRPAAPARHPARPRSRGRSPRQWWTRCAATARTYACPRRTAFMAALAEAPQGAVDAIRARWARRAAS